MIINPVSTEKAIRIMEAENKLILIVDQKSNKPAIKKEVEELFKVKVVSVNTFISQKGNKKAYVKLHKDYNAMDIATNLGLI